MNSVGELLKTRWLRQGVKLRRGATESETTSYENKYDVCLPEDMREFFAVVNGFDNRNGEEVDNDMITFFSLEEIKPLNVSDWGIASGAESFFVFANWSISAHVYAVRLVPLCWLFSLALPSSCGGFLMWARTRRCPADLSPRSQKSRSRPCANLSPSQKNTRERWFACEWFICSESMAQLSQIEVLNK
jgi:hypothetical protein